MLFINPLLIQSPSPYSTGKCREWDEKLWPPVFISDPLCRGEPEGSDVEVKGQAERGRKKVRKAHYWASERKHRTAGEKHWPGGAAQQWGSPAPLTGITQPQTAPGVLFGGWDGQWNTVFECWKEPHNNNTNTQGKMSKRQERKSLLPPLCRGHNSLWLLHPWERGMRLACTLNSAWG